MRIKTDNERRIARRNLVTGVFFGIIVATAVGAYATTKFTQLSKNTPATAKSVNDIHNAIATEIDSLKAEIDKLKATDCPPGYDTYKLSPDIMKGEKKDTTLLAHQVLCKRGKDEMVKVGDFWADRFEMTIANELFWDSGKCTGLGKRYGESGGGGTANDNDDYPLTFLDTGSGKAYACSIPGFVPSGTMTWFQAAQACAFAGKHLCTNSQWQIAATGTPGGTTVSCHVNSNTYAKTGANKKCESFWGTMDQVGNVMEWVSLWTVGGKSWITTNKPSGGVHTGHPWPKTYGLDATHNVNGNAWFGSSFYDGAPVAVVRGGNLRDKTDAGVFNFSLDRHPARAGGAVGARCCRR